MDSPATWAPMINALRADPEIRRHYQIWFYSYPSGYPYPLSAAIFRQQLDAIGAKYPDHKKIVLIGHSMGGCISRLLITDTGDQLWLKIFGTPPAQTPLSPEARKLVSESLIFRHRDDVGRVIFISAPLRGSELASNWAGRIGSMLVKSPAKLLKVGQEMMKDATFQSGDLPTQTNPEQCTDTLAPNNRFVKAIQTIPLTPRHSLSRHLRRPRQRRLHKDKTKPQMSDGVVPYWSSLHGQRRE